MNNNIFIIKDNINGSNRVFIKFKNERIGFNFCNCFSNFGEIKTFSFECLGTESYFYKNFLEFKLIKGYNSNKFFNKLGRILEGGLK